MKISSFPRDISQYNRYISEKEKSADSNKIFQISCNIALLSIFLSISGLYTNELVKLDASHLNNIVHKAQRQMRQNNRREKSNSPSDKNEDKNKGNNKDMYKKLENWMEKGIPAGKKYMKMSHAPKNTQNTNKNSQNISAIISKKDYQNVRPIKYS